MTTKVYQVAQPEQVFRLPPLSLVRATARKRIDEIELSSQDKRMAHGELDFLMGREHLRRLRDDAYEWRDQRRARARSHIVEGHELVVRLAIDREHARTQIATMRAKAINARLEIIERVRRMRHEDESRDPFRQLKRELRRVLLQTRVNRLKRRIQEDDLTERVLSRGRTIRRVREVFPDLADELADYYDRKQYEEGADE